MTTTTKSENVSFFLAEKTAIDFQYKNSIPFLLNLGIDLRICLTIFASLILCVGLLLRGVIVKFLSTLDVHSRPINILLWMDQVNFSRVAKSCLSMRFPHCFAFWTHLRWFSQTYMKQLSTSKLHLLYVTMFNFNNLSEQVMLKPIVKRQASLYVRIPH